MKINKKNFSKISVPFFKKISSWGLVALLLIFVFVFFQIYMPANPVSKETVVFTIQKGWSDDVISANLKKLGIIRSTYFFKFYAIVSLKHSSLQAGEYGLSPKMSIYSIVNKMARGDVIKDKLVILEGWNVNDIGKYLESKGICKQDYFVSLTKKDYSADYDFLSDKPSNVGLEGYIFPDTYQIARGESCEDVLTTMLDNFNQKLSLKLRVDIQKQNKSIFDVITMASLVEKEVRGTDDKKIASGILWKRIAIGMPLQLDSTINYITNKKDPSPLIKDTKIDSPYNTYKHVGLPKGPISNPGIDSIMAAIYPKKTNYLYWLSDGKTIFSETWAQHQAAIQQYLSK